MAADETKPLYQCFNCRFRWETSEPGPTGCPRCGSIYNIWLNHELWTDPQRARAEQRRNVR